MGYRGWAGIQMTVEFISVDDGMFCLSGCVLLLVRLILWIYQQSILTTPEAVREVNLGRL